MPAYSAQSSTSRYRGGLQPCLTGPARGGLPNGRSGHGVIAEADLPATGTRSDVFSLTPTSIGRATMMEFYVGLVH